MPEGGKENSRNFERGKRMMRRNILLLEPGYRNKYPPLGLMKLAQYHKLRSLGRDNIVFAKGDDDPKLEDYLWDRIYITTLFSFEWNRTARCIDRALALVNYCSKKIFVGGIAASLMTDEFEGEDRWKGIRFIPGLLDGPPAKALRLTGRDFGWKDIMSTPIEENVPDYDILKQVSYRYPVHDAYFGYASRGCIRKCSFCGVPKLEGGQRTMPPISDMVQTVDRLYGPRKDLILMDNNVSAAPNFNEIIAEIRDLGFVPGCKLKRAGRGYKRRVDFNQGVDARLLAKNSALIKSLSTISVDPLRIAFDHLGLIKPYEKSIRDAAQYGLTALSNYMLYNFHDSPEDLYKRLTVNIQLNEELGIRIWSFPMRYQPVTLKDRSFVGKNWNRYFLRSFQVMLQATHGVVTGNPEFFYTAFGASVEEFHRLLLLPHEFIFNRQYYFDGNGRSALDDYFANLGKLSDSQKIEVVSCLDFAWNATNPGHQFEKLDDMVLDSTIDKKIRNLLRYYRIYRRAKTAVAEPLSDRNVPLPDDQKIEDAGLFDDWSG